MTRGPNQARKRAPGRHDDAEKHQKRGDAGLAGHLRVGVMRTEPGFLCLSQVFIDLENIGGEVSQPDPENRMCQRDGNALAEYALPLCCTEPESE